MYRMFDAATPTNHLAAHFRIEMGRHKNLPVDNRLLTFLHEVENERHVLLEWHMYTDVLQYLPNKKAATIDHIMLKSTENKHTVLLSYINIIRQSAKTCFHILVRRNVFLCN